MQKLVPYTIALALLAFAGAAGAEPKPLAEWDDDVLVDDWRISQVLASEALTRTHDPMGQVYDVLIDESGYIESLIVRRKPTSDGTRMWKTDEGFLYYEVDWTDVDFNPSLAEAVLDKSRREIQLLPHREDASGFQSDGEYEASRLLDMPVHANDVAAYGKIDDLLFSRTVYQLTAFIVDLGGEGTHLLAVPADMDAVDYPESLIELRHDAEELEILEHFQYSEPE